MAGSYLLLCLLCCLCCLYPIHASLYSLRGIIRAPSVIPSKDVELHKYCAVLAATEPYKEVCVQQIRNFISPLKYWTMRIIGRKSDFQQADAIRDIEPCVHFALERYETSVRDAVRSYGLTVEEFNSISQQINSEKYLKRMIALQTYFYRIAGDLNANLKSSPPILPTISLPASPMVAARKLVDPYDGDRAVQKFNHKINQWYSDTTPELTRFATALLNIEYDRVNIREKLKRDLQINELPAKMADPELLPAMCKPIQRACREFPSIAASHIAKCGLHIEEFNALQRKVRRNPIYRTQVQFEIERIQRQASKNDDDN